MKQQTLLREVTIQGKGLHSGEEVTLTLKPAPPNHGIVFKRIDLYGKPEIKPRADLVTDLVRSTTIATDAMQIHTIEHVLSALNGMGVHNALIEMNNCEPPILDGSAKDYVNLIYQAEVVAQEADVKFFELKTPVSISVGNRSIIALPYDGFKISCTSSDDRNIHAQYLSLDITPAVYASQLAPARTFTIYEDIEPLLKLGKIKGGSLDSAVVIKGNQILSKEPLRFEDEFVRHKILDIIGDLSLLGNPIKAHIVAVRPGHALNIELVRKCIESAENAENASKKAKKVVVSPNDKTLDIKKILSLIPHRYPFVMIDRVIDISGDTLRAIKNVTINEPFFQGHFPGSPIMPGVLQLEAMAQAAGILMAQRIEHSEEKVTFFMSADKVKFRNVVMPGDQLDITIQLLKIKTNKNSSIGLAEGVCKVGERVVSSAQLVFSIGEAPQF